MRDRISVGQTNALRNRATHFWTMPLILLRQLSVIVRNCHLEFGDVRKRSNVFVVWLSVQVCVHASSAQSRRGG